MKSLKAWFRKFLTRRPKNRYGEWEPLPYSFHVDYFALTGDISKGDRNK